MPDPIASASFVPNLSCNFDDDPSLSCVSEPAAASEANNTCSSPAATSEPATSSAVTLLVQAFPPAGDRARLAPPLADPAQAAPFVLSVHPDQINVQAGAPRLQAQAKLGNVQLTASVDALNANAHLGSLNGDGSHGENIGAGATLIGGELNIAYKGWSLTLGMAASLGGSISSGEGRDVDGNGVPERCFAMSLGPYTLGECDEL